MEGGGEGTAVPSGHALVCSNVGAVVATLQVAWHQTSDDQKPCNLPVLACDVRGSRLITGGGDNNARLWSLCRSGENILPPRGGGVGEGTLSRGGVECTFVATLAMHSKSVNAVRFSPDAARVATGGDDGLLLVWACDAEKTAALVPDNPDTEYASEVWRVEHRIALATDVYDVAWNAAGTELAVASTDHKTTVFQLRDNGAFVKLAELSHHLKYVQGVAFDPRGDYLASASNDKTVRIFSLFNKTRMRRKTPTCEAVVRKV